MKKSIAKSYDKIARAYVFQHEDSAHLSKKSLDRFVSFLPQNASVLDVGCGGGRDAKYLFERGVCVRGIDVSARMIRLAKSYAPDIVFENIDVMELSVRKKYDGVWCCRVFHHISLNEQERFLKRLKALTQKGGIIFLTSVVSDTKEDYEALDSGNDGLLKKRLMPKSFKKLLLNQGFILLHFRYWTEGRGMEVIVKRSH